MLTQAPHLENTMRLLFCLVVALGFSQLAFADAQWPTWLTEEMVNGKFHCQSTKEYTIDTETQTMTFVQNGATRTGAYSVTIASDRVSFSIHNTWLNFWENGKIDSLFQDPCEKVAP